MDRIERQMNTYRDMPAHGYSASLSAPVPEAPMPSALTNVINDLCRKVDTLITRIEA